VVLPEFGFGMGTSSIVGLSAAKTQYVH
jgi:hypothetical protein